MLNTFVKKANLLPLTVICFGMLFCNTSMAATEPDNQWHGNVSIGGAIESSNSSSQTLNLSTDSVRATAEDKVSLRALVNYASNTSNNVKTRTAELFRLGGRYDYNLSETVFLFTGGELEKNKIQNIHSRYNVNLGAGYKVIRSDDVTFDLFTGVGYSGTKYVTVIPPEPSRKNSAQLLFGEELTYKIGTDSNFKERWVVYPGQSDIGVRSTLDMSLVTAVTGGWTLNVGAAVSYDSKPSGGLKKTTSLITFGFGYKY